MSLDFPKNFSELYVGLMSGTSMDAIDAVIADFAHFPPKIIGTYSKKMPAKVRQEILELSFPSSNMKKDGIEQLAQLDVELGYLFADAVLNLLKKTKISAKNILAIGSHGQTIRHHPNAKTPYTLQIGDPNIITAQTNITTVADFRRRDIALGGQGAPLAPAFHQYYWQKYRENLWIVNIGGIANVTFLPTASSDVEGFDTGPGNTLLDTWCFEHRKKTYDQEGKWADSGKIIPELLTAFLADPYFRKSHPKSTGRDYFNLTWLEKYLLNSQKNYLPQDVQATLVELTAQTIIQAILNFNKQGSIWICGGGAHNIFLMKRLKHLSPFTVSTTQKIGLDPQWVEALAFAWLAQQTLEAQSLKLKTITGAKIDSIIGGIYPANRVSRSN